MEIVISVSEVELEEFPEEAPESSEQSSETLHTPGTVKSLLSIDTSPTPELLDKIRWGRVTYLIGNTPKGGSDSRSQTYRVSKQPTLNHYSKQPWLHTSDPDTYISWVLINHMSTNRVRFNLPLCWVFEMAAPVPPRGRGGPGGGLAPQPPPPPPPPGPPGPVGPADPPGPPPTGATLLAQMLAAMQAAAAGLPAQGPGGPAPPLTRVKIPPPIFKSLPGERPEAHLLRANDWMDTYNILPVNKPANFKHTLDHLAREWYDSLTFPIAWNDLQQRFSQYFSTQGRSIKHLRDKW